MNKYTYFDRENDIYDIKKSNLSKFLLSQGFEKSIIDQWMSDHDSFDESIINSFDDLGEATDEEVEDWAKTEMGFYSEENDWVNESQLTTESLRMQMLAGIITESQYKQKSKELDSKLKFHQVERDRKYFATTNFGIFKKGDEVFVDTVRNLGTEVVLELSNSKGKHDSIKGDLEDEVEVFDNNSPLNENQYKSRLDEEEYNII